MGSSVTNPAPDRIHQKNKGGPRRCRPLIYLVARALSSAYTHCHLMMVVLEIPVSAIGQLSILPCLLALMFPLCARADCQQWDAAGGWNAVQSNITADSGHSQPSFSLEQTGSELRGSASFYRAERGEEGHQHTASVDGAIKGNELQLTAYWDDGSIGIYSGTISSLGRAEGETYDRLNSGDKAHWYGDRRFNCLSVAPVAPVTPHAVGFGRVAPRTGAATGPATGTMICDAATSARARNSPAASGLERRCAEYRSNLLLTTTVAPTIPLLPLAAQLDSLAATGAKIAQVDPAVAEARSAESGAFYQIGFDVATGLFGDPAMGGQGNTVLGPESASIRDSLSAAGQRGFNDSVAFHLARDYRR